MQVIMIFGPHAVGKMTVGQELEKMSGFKLFHNHVPIEMVLPYFGYSTRAGRQLVHKIREAFFRAFAESDEAGYILTCIWQFDAAGEQEYMDWVASIFEEHGAEVHWVELEANLEERLKRNKSANRLSHKPSKRDLEVSEQRLIESHKKHRLNSRDGELTYKNYLRIDNSDLKPAVVARQVLDWLQSRN